MNQFYFWQFYQYFLTILKGSIEKAYKASKNIQKLKKNYFVYKNMVFSSRRSWQSILFFINTELNNSIFIIYWNLVKCKFSFYFFIFFYKVYFFLSNFLFKFFSKKNLNKKFDNSEKINFSIILNKLVEKEINRKLIWIEATLIDLDIWKNYYLFSFFEKEENKNKNFFKYSKSIFTIKAFESIGLVPRSITRTFSRFQEELKNKSNLLVIQEFRLAKYQALASLQYIGCLIFIPLGIATFCKKYFFQPWIINWWNTCQSKIFFTSFQEEKALKKLQEIEELFWLDNIIINSFKLKSQNFVIEIHKQTIELVKIYNENSIQTLSNFFTDLIYFITLSALFILGKKRLVILNSWVQELFYSLSDTMKAFFILLLTDLFIGFHSPHGWEIFISFCLEHFGFVHNKHVISCFVSTFPVILDTVFKYWIFRHLNRISPSIVATYRTMTE